MLCWVFPAADWQMLAHLAQAHCSELYAVYLLQRGQNPNVETQALKALLWQHKRLYMLLRCTAPQTEWAQRLLLLVQKLMQLRQRMAQSLSQPGQLVLR